VNTKLGIKGGEIKGQEALARINDMKDGDAQRVLQELKTQISHPDGRSKSGRLKLLNSRHGNREMKFSRSGWFRSRGSTLRRTGEALSGILKQAGLSEAELNGFKSYLRQRSKWWESGVQKSVLLNYINLTLQPRDKAIEAAGIRFADNGLLGSGGFGSARKVIINGKPAVYKCLAKMQPVSIQMLKNERGRNEFKMHRKGEGTASLLEKDGVTRRGLENIVRPSGYLIRICRPNAPDEYRMQKADKSFRQFVIEQTKKERDAKILIAGVVMPEARGKELKSMLSQKPNNPMETGKEPVGEGKGPADLDLKNIASSGLKTIRAMSDHGFVHGDIKPANLFYDKELGQLHFIDTGGIAKISKRAVTGNGKIFTPGKGEGFGYFYAVTDTLFNKSHGFTRSYTNPLLMQSNRGGHEQDLFSMGVTILECALYSRGKTKEAQKVLQLTHKYNTRNYSTPNDVLDGIKNSIGEVADDSPEHLALACLESAINHRFQKRDGKASEEIERILQHKFLGGEGIPDLSQPEDVAPNIAENSDLAKMFAEQSNAMIGDIRPIVPSVLSQVENQFPENADVMGNQEQRATNPAAPIGKQPSVKLPTGFQIGNVEAVEESGKETGGDPDQMTARLQGMKRGESYNFHVNLLQDQKAEMTGKISDYLGKSDEATLARRKEEFDRDSGRCTRTFILGSREGSDEQRIIFTSGMMPGKPPFIKNSNALEQAVKEKTPFESWQVLQDHIQPLLTQAGLALLFNGLKNEGVDLSNLRTDSSNTANPASGTNFETRIAGDGTVNVKCTHWLKPEAFDDGEPIDIPLDVSDSKVTQSYELEFRFSPGEGSPLGKMDLKIKSVEVEGSLARS